MKRRNRVMFLEDIIESMNRIESYLSQVSYDEFSQNQMLIDATVRNLEIIGEAVRYIPNDLQNEYTSIPWRKMKGLRNILIHKYFGIDEENVWEIATRNLPETKKDIEQMIHGLKKSGH